MAEEKKVLAGKRIGVLGKGGSGKSTTVVLLAKALRNRGYEVCVLDADSTNVGLHRALGIEQPSVPLLDYFGGMAFRGGLVTCPVNDPTPLPGAEIALDKLDMKHASRNDDGILFLTASKIGDRGLGAGCDGPVAKIARDLRVRQDDKHPVTLVDFKAGLEDPARGAVTSLDWIIVIVDPTVAAIELAADMRDMVDQVKAGRLPVTQNLEIPKLIEWTRILREATIKDVIVMLNRVGDEETEAYVRKKLAEKGIEPIGVIHEDPSIARCWLRGTPLVATDAHKDAEKVVEKLEAVAERSSVPVSTPARLSAPSTEEAPTSTIVGARAGRSLSCRANSIRPLIVK